MRHENITSADIQPIAKKPARHRAYSDMDPEYMTINEYGRVFGPCRTTTYKLINRGDLVSSAYAGRTYIEVQSARNLAARSIVKKGLANGE